MAALASAPTGKSSPICNVLTSIYIWNLENYWNKIVFTFVPLVINYLYVVQIIISIFDLPIRRQLSEESLEGTHKKSLEEIASFVLESH